MKRPTPKPKKTLNATKPKAMTSVDFKTMAIDRMKQRSMNY